MTAGARKRGHATPPSATSPGVKPPFGASASAEPDAEAAAAYRLEDQIGFRLRKAHQRATDIFGEVMKEFDVTPMQFAALAKLDDLGQASQNQLGRLVAMDPATTFGVVGRLVRRGLVRSQPSAEDARASVLTLTEAGRRTVVAMKSRGAEVSRRTLAPLEPREQRLLLDLIARLA